MSEVYTFSAGPAAMPGEVLRRAQNELLDYRGTGISVMELSHRSEEFGQIIETAETRLRELMSLPKNYVVLFLQGGASTQFSMVPINLYERGRADYVDTGNWSQRAIAEARRYGQVRIVASSERSDFTTIPPVSREMCDPEADFCHITMNNTVRGTRFVEIPDTGGVPLVSDVSSFILSERFDISKFGLIYAGAQKNIGPAGLTVVIARQELLGRAKESTPPMFDYAIHAEKRSLYNTPPCFAIYIAGLVFEWIQAGGGIEAMEQRNKAKADVLYDYLDNSRLFQGVVDRKFRSLMNVTFKLPDTRLTALFLSATRKRGLLSLAGHRSVGGLRASLYNAMPIEGVSTLVDVMSSFEKEYG
jgi:phosphoserine aminotransferase